MFQTTFDIPPLFWSICSTLCFSWSGLCTQECAFCELAKFLAVCVHVHAHMCLNTHSTIDLIRTCWFSYENLIYSIFWMSRCEIYHAGMYLLLNQKLSHTALIKSQYREIWESAIHFSNQSKVTRRQSQWLKERPLLLVYQLWSSLASLILEPNKCKCLHGLLGFPP